MTRNLFGSITALALLGFAAHASADPSTFIGSYPDADPSRGSLVTPHGTSITMGFGGSQFASQATRDLTGGPGGYFDVRGVYGTRSLLGVEGAYTLSARGLSEERYHGDTPALFGHGLEAALRLNVPMHQGRLFYAPFAVAGLGWTAFVRTDEDGQHALHRRETDHVATIPLGLGWAMSYRMFYADARLMIRPALGEDLGQANGQAANLQTWNLGVSGGIEF